MLHLVCWWAVYCLSFLFTTKVKIITTAAIPRVIISAEPHTHVMMIKFVDVDFIPTVEYGGIPCGVGAMILDLVAPTGVTAIVENGLEQVSMLEVVVE